jgi:hypothetical protein
MCEIWGVERMQQTSVLSVKLLFCFASDISILPCIYETSVDAAELTGRQCPVT